jgi:acetoin utilization protein AcuB
MRVSDWMSSPVITVDVQDTMQQAVDLMTEHEIGMLPVLDRGKLVGIVTDRDLRQAGPSSVKVFEIKQILYRLSRVKMEEIMTSHLLTVSPDFTIEEAAEVLRENNISGCPVLDRKGELVGIITKNDIFRAITSVIRMAGRGVQFGFVVEDKPGRAEEVTDIIRKYRARLINVVCTHEGAPEGYRCLHVRTFNINREKLPEMKEELKKKATILYIVDLREGTRETYTDHYKWLVCLEVIACLPVEVRLR